MVFHTMSKGEYELVLEIDVGKAEHLSDGWTQRKKLIKDKLKRRLSIGGNAFVHLSSPEKVGLIMNQELAAIFIRNTTRSACESGSPSPPVSSNRQMRRDDEQASES